MAGAVGRGADLDWFEELPCSITVCDRKYKILYMNDSAAKSTAEDGGKTLIGKNLLDCHPPDAQRKLKRVMASGRPEVYTIEKKGLKEIVYHGHWKKGGRVGGLVEIVLVLPKRVPHHIRR